MPRPTNEYWMVTMRKQLGEKVLFKTFTTSKHPLEYLDIQERTEGNVEAAILFAMPIDGATFERHAARDET